MMLVMSLIFMMTRVRAFSRQINQDRCKVVETKRIICGKSSIFDHRRAKKPRNVKPNAEFLRIHLYSTYDRSTESDVLSFESGSTSF